MKAATFRRLSLALPGVTEAPHFDRVAFRAGRIFATLAADGASANVLIDPSLQEVLGRAHPGAVAPVDGAWGSRGWTTLTLAGLTAADMKPILAEAHALASRPAGRRKAKTAPTKKVEPATSRRATDDSDALERSLREVATPARAEKEKAYLKSELAHLGATVPATRRIAKAFVKAHPDYAREDVARLVEALWSRGVFELRNVAVEIVNLTARRLDARDVALVERMLRDAHTWALVDAIAVNVLADLLARHPEIAKTLDRWSKDDDFWIRRSAMLALLPAMRRGEGDFARFGRYADAMLEEKEFFIRKAIGWILRDVSRRDPAVFPSSPPPRAHRASGVTVREAVKRLPKARAAAIMKAYRDKRPIQ